MKRFCISSYWLCLYPNEISIDSELIQTGVNGPGINVFRLLKVPNNATYIIKYKKMWDSHLDECIHGCIWTPGIDVFLPHVIKWPSPPPSCMKQFPQTIAFILIVVVIPPIFS